MLKIDDITDLELSDFNSWDIKLEEYQQALDHELAGRFTEAKKIYEDNKLNNDVYRITRLEGEMMKELRDNGEVQLVFEEVVKGISK